MAIRQIRIGSLENITQYDDGDYIKSISVTDPIECTAAPVDPDDVLRLDDVGYLAGNVIGPALSIDSNIVEFDGVTGKLIKDGGLSHVDASDAISKKHTQGTDTALGVLGTKDPPIDADKVIYRNSTALDALVTSTWTQIKSFLKTYFDTLYGSIGSSHTRQHSITDTSDHTSTATSGQMLKADANGLPVNATNTDAQVSGAVSASHTRSHAISSTSDHSDVNLAGISNNDLMRWDDPSSKWLPKSIAEVISGNSISPGPITISDVEDWRYAASIADDGTKELPTIKADYAAIGNIVISSSGVIDESAEFEIDSTGTCQIIRGSANVIVNADTDTKVCLGTSAAQNPLTIKNRLGGVKNIMITLMYVKA